MSKIIGIDLGTTHARVAVVEGGEVVVIPDDAGLQARTSVLVGDGKGGALNGEDALNRSEIQPEMAATDIRRKLGLPGGGHFGSLSITPEEAAVTLLLLLKRQAEAYLGEGVSEVVLTVPNAASQAQRKALLHAASLAGFSRARLINEADAVLVAGAWNYPEPKKVLVFELGGGCASVSVGEAGDEIFEVLTSGGLTRLGGLDFDAALMKPVAERFAQETGFDPLTDPVAAARLRRAVEKARVALTTQTAARVFVPCIGLQNGAPVHLDQPVTRDELEAATSEAVSRLAATTQRLLVESLGEKFSQGVDELVFAGGCARTPAVRQAIRKLVGGAKVLEAADSAAVRGAALYGGMLNGDFKNRAFALLPVTAMDVGVETANDVFTRIIERGTALPTLQKQTFSTVMDNQTTIDVHVKQGLSDKASENESVLRTKLTVPPAPKGVPKIEIELEIDMNGIISLSHTVQAPPTEAENTDEAEPKAETPKAPGPQDQDARAVALREAVAAMLPTMDNLELAIRAGNGSPGAEAIVRGVELTLRGMKDALQKLGLEEIPAQDQPFDPMLHHAVEYREGGRSGYVTTVVERGYRLNGQVLRYAKVVVSK